MKKIISILLTVAVLLGVLAACGDTSTNDESSAAIPESGNTQTESKKLKIVTTIFPEYDWVIQLLGADTENAEVTMLLDNGVDLHSYQPTAEDIMKISTCDIFIYVGGESDEWVEDALKEATNKDMVVINLLDVLGDSVKAEEIKEGMEAEQDHDHDETHDKGDGEHGEEYDNEEEEEESDEHVWLSLKNAAVICEAIADSLAEIDPDNADSYKANFETYKTKLSDLDKQYESAAAAGLTKTLLFGDRFPFRYLTDDYGLDYFAAFVGCSAETEASFETVKFLSEKVDELDLKYVLTIEKSDQKIAKTIIDNTESKDQKILTLDSMQSTTMKDVKSGTTYLSVMESNLNVLRTVLS